jgi:uncharacterized protein YndB with AHSA1/START domain
VNDELRLERTYDASPEEVFDAWTNPTVLKRWWAPGPEWESPNLEVDLRVGGQYRLATRHPHSGEVFTVGGEYTEVERPSRLSYSWAWENGPHADHVSTVTVEFRGGNGRTTVVLTHTRLESDRSYGFHAYGWTEVMESLEQRVFSATDRA